jgi:outer membrane protein assembly factor BamB
VRGGERRAPFPSTGTAAQPRSVRPASAGGAMMDSMLRSLRFPTAGAPVGGSAPAVALALLVALPALGAGPLGSAPAPGDGGQDAAAAGAAGATPEAWTSWGGPRGDFTAAGGPLAEAWPAEGPRRLWQRPLGGGYSSVLYAEGRLYTLYRDGGEEVMVALDAATGATLWEHRDTPTFWPDMDKSFGLGPNSTPLLITDRAGTAKVVGIGISGTMRAVDARSGTLSWRRDLPREHGRHKRDYEYGYSGNPMAYRGTILALVGGTDAAVVALDPSDGAVVWKSAPGDVSYAQPTIGRLAGREHYLFFEQQGLVALDPATGKTLWKHGIPYRYGTHLTPAVRCDESHLWVSSQFDAGGGRLLEVSDGAAGLGVKELWFSPKLRTSHWTLHCRGDFLYGSLGGNDTSRLAAVRWRSGEIVWQERGFVKAQALWADGKLLFLDETGKVALARVSPQKLEVLASAEVAQPNAWTLPTLAGTTLFVRDQEKILALDLAPPSRAAVHRAPF